MRPEHEWFKPEKLTAYYFLAEVIAAVFSLAIATIVVAAVLFEGGPLWIIALIGLPLVIAFGYVTWWIPTFYRTAAYRFTDEEIEYRRGVFFQQKTSVPYNRITNVNASQGPLQRLVDAGSVSLHTAGYGGQMGAELTIGGVSDFEDIESQVLEKVRRRPAVATEAAAGAEPVPDGVEADGSELLAEVRRIRALLEDVDSA